MKRLLITLIVTILAGCASGPPIDRSVTSVAQDSRVRFLVMHYTVIPTIDASLRVLAKDGVVSSHYLVNDTDGKIYGLVDENRRSFHAGISSWRGVNNLNFSSVGIEIVNKGFTEENGVRTYYPFTPQQVDAVLALAQDIIKRHNIAPENVIGHSDIAPQRKSDPGPLFPWKKFAEKGLILWPDEARVAELRPAFEASLPDAAWFQKKLAQVGYLVPANGQLDKETQNVIVAFQTKYRPAKFDGQPDGETAAMLEVLTTKPLPPTPPAAPTPPAPPAPVPTLPAK